MFSRRTRSRQAPPWLVHLVLHGEAPMRNAEWVDAFARAVYASALSQNCPARCPSVQDLLAEYHPELIAAYRAANPEESGATTARRLSEVAAAPLSTWAARNRVEACAR